MGAQDSPMQLGGARQASATIVGLGGVVDMRWLSAPWTLASGLVGCMELVRL